MKPLDVLGVRVEMPTSQPIVLLRERDGGRHVPIWIGAAEATAIAYAQEGVQPPRPLTHDLLVDVLEALGRTLTTVRIDAVLEGVFHATLVLDDSTEISARTSDGIALALRTDAEILATDEVLDEVGIESSDEEEDEVAKFKEFLDEVSPEDFEAPDEGPSAT
ncbi:bifunctional nuclease family protein [Janibacter terrae]|uniref:Bifunctional nuclease family protein n=1 Tax=Janibacter terrae TaxID=103817 RepID=A0ABZ2FFH5_9MICO|nr:bifunctional nuclease family protein [Janibacter terrae]MBA4085181.1 bifunctional nuclease family protein [Kytococcus sp.]HCE59851.1 bifunctional nuclease family protein [Janibacter terrae]